VRGGGGGGGWGVGGGGVGGGKTFKSPINALGDSGSLVLGKG